MSDGITMKDGNNKEERKQRTATKKGEIII
jgi:hypothetical protein